MTIIVQQALLEELGNLMLRSAVTGYESLKCRFDYSCDQEDGSSTTGARFSYRANGEDTSAALLYPDREVLPDILPKLHAAMKEHTGGDWNAFTIEIDANGQAKTLFEY